MQLGTLMDRLEFEDDAAAALEALGDIVLFAEVQAMGERYDECPGEYVANAARRFARRRASGSTSSAVPSSPARSAANAGSGSSNAARSQSVSRDINPFRYGLHPATAARNSTTSGANPGKAARASAAAAARTARSHCRRCSGIRTSRLRVS